MWEAFTVQSLTASSLTLASPTVGAFQASRTYVIPVLSCRLLEPARLSRPVPGMAEISVHLLQEP